MYTEDRIEEETELASVDKHCEVCDIQQNKSVNCSWRCEVQEGFE